MILTSRAATDYIDFTCPHEDCGYQVSVPNRTDIYFCPGCDTLVLVTAQPQLAIGAGTNLRGPV